MSLTVEQVKKIAGSQAKNAIVEPLVEFINAEGDKYNLDTPKRIALFLGHCAVESAYFTMLIENLNYSVSGLMRVWPKRFKTAAAAKPYANNPQALANFVYNGRMGNKVGTNDGWLNRGMGIKQVTGVDNRRAFTKWVQKVEPSAPDFVKYPEKVAEMPWAILSAVWFWTDNDVYQYADKKEIDIEGSTRAINGGLTGLEDRKIVINKAVRVLVNSQIAPKTIVEKKPRKKDDVLQNYQTKLNAIADYKKEPTLNVGKADGWFGKKTEDAIKAFQVSAEIDETGTLDAKTMEAIDNVMAVIETGKVTSISEDLNKPQEAVVVDEVPVSIPARLMSTIDQPIYKDKSILTYVTGGGGFFTLIYSKGKELFLGLDPIVQAAIIIALAACVIFAFQGIRESLRARKGMKELKQNVKEARADTEEVIN